MIMNSPVSCIYFSQFHGGEVTLFSTEISQSIYVFSTESMCEEEKIIKLFCCLDVIFSIFDRMM